RSADRGAGPKRAAQFVNLDKDPMERHAVGLAASRDAGAPTWEPSPGERCNSRISTKTLWSAVRSASWRAGTPERQPVSRPQATGQSGERRTRGRSADSLSLRGAKRRGNPHEGAYRLGDCFATLAMTATFRRSASFTRLPCPRREAQFVNLDKD